jgi:hypothetical protein
MLTWMTVVAVCIYYGVVWYVAGRDPRQGTIVTRYEPPAGLSPAMLRYVWKQKFDDRTFWAGLLDLVAKGLALLESEDGTTCVRAVPTGKHKPVLPREERYLLDKVMPGAHKNSLSMNVLDDWGSRIWGMETELRKAAIGRFFTNNREVVTFGALLSLVPVYVSAQVQDVNDLLALVWSLALMGPSSFYMLILLPHFRDLFRGGRVTRKPTIARRMLPSILPLLACFAAIITGGIVLGVNFGLQILVVTAFMFALNLVFVHLMKAPTAEGRRVMDEIEGFRQFLSSVDRFSMDRSEAPSQYPGLYEKYLPFAIALEVEQGWSDKLLALAGSLPEWEFWSGRLHLGLGEDDGLSLTLPRRKGNVARMR